MTILNNPNKFLELLDAIERGDIAYPYPGAQYGAESLCKYLRYVGEKEVVPRNKRGEPIGPPVPVPATGRLITTLNPEVDQDRQPIEGQRLIDVAIGQTDDPLLSELFGPVHDFWYASAHLGKDGFLRTIAISTDPQEGEQAIELIALAMGASQPQAEIGFRITCDNIYHGTIWYGGTVRKPDEILPVFVPSRKYYPDRAPETDYEAGYLAEYLIQLLEACVVAYPEAEDSPLQTAPRSPWPIVEITVYGLGAIF